MDITKKDVLQYFAAGTIYHGLKTDPAAMLRTGILNNERIETCNRVNAYIEQFTDPVKRYALHVTFLTDCSAGTAAYIALQHCGETAPAAGRAQEIEQFISTERAKIGMKSQ